MFSNSEVATCFIKDGTIVDQSKHETNWVYLWLEGNKISRIGSTWLHPISRTEKHISVSKPEDQLVTAFKIRKKFTRDRIKLILADTLGRQSRLLDGCLVGNVSMNDLEPTECSPEEQSYVDAIVDYVFPTWRPPTIETKRLTLRAVRLDDAEDIFKYASDPEVTKYCFFDTHKTIDDANFFIKEMAFDSYSEKVPEPFGITLSGEDRIIGCCGCFWVSRQHKIMELGYIIDKPYWGQGMVVEAAKAAMDFVFKNYAVERLQCRCKTENAGSKRVMEKLGFKEEGVLRSALWHRDRFWDMHTTSILRSEWK